ncbi:hypothetical protein QBA78_36500 [Streptomyces scabiei]|uniref:hypothetical protein n=1 Tax=Streptomyces scabiei TaxID=1930 RepID=UPI002FF03A64
MTHTYIAAARQSQYETKDSGQRDEFSSGMLREPDTVFISLYVVGYATTVIGLVNGHMAQINAQTDVAQTWWARKQGRERCSVHDANRRTARCSGRAA